MGRFFVDVWLPEVEAEFLALLEHSRGVGVDVGNQFRALERLLERGLDRAWRPVDRLVMVDVYVMYGSAALMFFAVECVAASTTANANLAAAVQLPRLAVVKWGVLGTEHEQTLALAEAKARAIRAFE